MITYYNDYVLERLKYLSALAKEKPMVYRAKIVAGIYIRNKLVSIGENSYKTHPFQARFSKHEDCIYLHAEIDAIKNALREIGVDECFISSGIVSCGCSVFVGRRFFNSVF